MTGDGRGGRVPTDGIGVIHDGDVQSSDGGALPEGRDAHPARLS
jgi:hypothetical protein